MLLYGKSSTPILLDTANLFQAQNDTKWIKCIKNMKQENADTAKVNCQNLPSESKTLLREYNKLYIGSNGLLYMLQPINRRNS